MRSIHFWRKNQIVAKRHENMDEIKKSDEAIRFAMERCDDLGVTFKLQNKVLHAAENDVSFSEVRKEITKELKVLSNPNKQKDSQNER